MYDTYVSENFSFFVFAARATFRLRCGSSHALLPDLPVLSVVSPSCTVVSGCVVFPVLGLSWPFAGRSQGLYPPYL